MNKTTLGSGVVSVPAHATSTKLFRTPHRAWLGLVPALLVVVIGLALTAGTASAQTYRTWIGPTDNKWSRSDQWSPTDVPDTFSEYALFDSTGTRTFIMLDNSFTIGGIKITGSPTATYITQSGTPTLSVGSGGVDMSGATAQFSFLNAWTYKVASNQTWLVTGSGDLNVGSHWNLANPAPTVNLLSNTLTINAGTGRTVTFVTNSQIIGAGGQIIKTGVGSLVLMSTNNTYTGNTTISAGTLTLADNANLKFVIGASGVNNQINGSGTATLDGDFTFDLTLAGTTVGNSWTIVDVGSLTETFGSTFTLASTVGAFTGGEGAGTVWTRDENGVTYQFSEATGILSVIPEPSTWMLVCSGLVLALLARRRR